MKTVISTFYLNLINQLAEKFASDRASLYPKKSRKKVYNSTLKIYKEISLYLYLKLNKTSINRKKFSFNHIYSTELKKFSCKLYFKIISDLTQNKIIAVNRHYYHGNPEISFSKSYLIHRKIFSKIDELKQKFKYKLTEVEIPEKITCMLNLKNVKNEDDQIFTQNKLNTFNRTNTQKKNIFFYNQLKYDENKLEEYCKNDEFLYNFNKKKLLKLQMDPKFIKSRWYHSFHEFSKKFRENVLLFEGENLKEIFDISASDMHMLAKHLETVDSIPFIELSRFQKEVKEDMRKKFGIKKNGKCTAAVKKAFKVYLNLKKEKYSSLKENSLALRIDNYFKKNYPHIREYIVNTENIWQITMDEEFSVISEKMTESLLAKGIKVLTCHDAIYVKKSVEIPYIEKMFYQKLDFISDRTEKLMNL